MAATPETNGQTPHLVGLACEALLAEQYRHQGKLSDRANAIWLRFGGCWHRLYFDCGIIFWRTSEAGPEPYRLPELGGEVRIVDLAEEFGILGESVVSCDARAVTGGSEVRLAFRSGRSVVFRNVDDQTTYTG